MLHNLCESNVSLKATPVVLQKGIGENKDNLSTAFDARHNILYQCNTNLTKKLCVSSNDNLLNQRNPPPPETSMMLKFSSPESPFHGHRPSTLAASPPFQESSMSQPKPCPRGCMTQRCQSDTPPVNPASPWLLTFFFS